MARAALALFLGLALVAGARAQTIGPILNGPYSLPILAKTTTYANSFNGTGPALVRVQLSAPNILTTGSLVLNGTQLMTAADFAGGITQVDRPVTLIGSNSFSFTVGGTRGATVTLTVYRLIMPTPSGLTPNPLALTLGTGGTLTATLSPVPTASGTLSVSSGNTAVATVPASIAFAANQASVAIPVTSVGSGSATVTATANGGQATATVNVNAPPTVSLTSPAGGTVFAAPAGITLTASAADPDGTIAKVEFFEGATLLGTATAAPYSVSLANVASGTHAYTAKATDNLGAATTSGAVSVISDTPAAVSITSPTSGTVFSAPASFTIAAAATDADGTIAKVEFFEGATLLGASTSAPYSVALTGVAAGNHSYTARATDNNGIATTSGAVSVVVNALPSVSITSPAAGASFNAPASITITANAADTDGTVAKVDFYQGTTLLGTSTAAPYSFAWTGVAAGSYSLTAVATDNLGGTTTSAAVAITVNALPSVSITAPTDGAVFAAPATITVTANASDPDGSVAKVDFFQGATLIGTATAAPYSAMTASLGSGTYSFTAVATDNSGATTTSAAVNVRVNAAPTVSISAPASGASFTAPASIAISAAAADTDGTIVSVAFYQNGSLITTLSSAPYSITWTGVPAGSYSLTAVATDDAGTATTSAAVSVTVTAAVAQMYFIHPDHLNTPRAVADAGGTVVWRWDQTEPFGDSVPNGDPSGFGTFEFNLRFPGQYADRETSLAYNVMRDFDSRIGRYVQSDPVGLLAGINTYIYVHGNPISFSDPTGLIEPTEGDAAVGLIEGIIAGIHGRKNGEVIGKQLCRGGLSNQGLWSDCFQACQKVSHGSEEIFICSKACQDHYKACKSSPQSSCPTPKSG
jgi:RHS repeat-associated protein